MSIMSNQAISMSAGLSTLYTVFQNTDDILNFEYSVKNEPILMIFTYTMIC